MKQRTASGGWINDTHTKAVQYGCGQCAPQNWLNFDASPRLRFERLFPTVKRVFPNNVRYGDIVRGLPLRRGSADLVYCSHVLEHLALADFRVALKNTFELLRPGGIFRLVVPDLQHDAREYLTSNELDASLKFMSNTHLGHPSRDRGIRGLMVAWLGNSRHLWMWDERSLTVELARAGFAGVRRAQFGDSEFSLFNDVEDERQWGVNLGMECRKPVTTNSAS